jgi:hypothetical protein
MIKTLRRQVKIFSTKKYAKSIKIRVLQAVSAALSGKTRQKQSVAVDY